MKLALAILALLIAAPTAYASDTRPKFRWWWATPYSAQDFTDEVDAFAGAGFGGAEAAFNADGWATPEQRSMLNASLQRARQRGMKLDMTIGASWPVTTPNTKPGSGLSEQELMYGRTDLTGGSTFTGKAPEPNDGRTGELVAVTAARLLSGNVLDPGSLTDLTSRVSSDGSLTWDVPSGNWILFGFWQRDAEEGVMDHLSAASLKAVTDFVDANQIGAENEPLLRSAGGDFFEDSLELDAVELFWTDRFATEFKARRGYDLTKYLPLFFVPGENRYWVPDQMPAPDFDLPNGLGDRLRHDYYETLTDLYVDYHLKGFAAWARTHAMQYRVQAGFGNSFDAIRSAREVARAGGIADDETLNAGDPTALDGAFGVFRPGFNPQVNNGRFVFDHYRTVAGGAHQGGQTEVGFELGAVLLRADAMNLSDYKQMMDKAWAAGITRPIVHGYAHQPAGSPWPGRDQFFRIVSESWNHRTFPQWSMWKPLTDYWTRGAAVLESGTPRTDVAVYRDGFVTSAANFPFTVILKLLQGGTLTPEDLDSPDATPFFDGVPLERAGYTLEYVDPVGLRDPQAAGWGVLYPKGPAYRALVIDQRTLPAATAEAIARAAERGLSVVFVGDLPSRGTSFTDDDRAVQNAVARILRTRGARRVGSQAEVAGALASAGVQPAARWSRPVSVYSQRRDTTWYLWNASGQTESFTATFDAGGTPYRYDLWTGRTEPIEARGREVPLTLRPGETTVITFGHGHPVQARDVRLGRPLTLSSWRLHVDATGPEGTTPHDLVLNGLKDWREIPELAEVAGTATYTTRVFLKDHKAHLDLGAIAGAVQVYVNGRRLTPDIDPVKPIDAADLLHKGSNEIRVVLTTPLRNKVQQVARTTDDPLLTVPRNNPYTQPNGLLGPVRLIPYTYA